MRTVIWPEQKPDEGRPTFSQACENESGETHAADVDEHFRPEPAAERARVGEERDAKQVLSHARTPSSFRARAAATWLARRSASARATAMPRSVNS